MRHADPRPVPENPGSSVEILATCGGVPVMVKQGRFLAMTFHPELTGDGRVHEVFVGLVG